MKWDFDAFLLNGALMPAGPNEFWLGLGLELVARGDEFCWYAPDFYLRGPKTWFRPKLVERWTREALLSRLDQIHESAPSLRERTKRTFADFQNIFHKIQEGIERGSWRKIVPISMGEYETEIRSPQVAHCLKNMLHLPENLSPYGMWNEEGGILGASPEWLFRKEGNRLSTMALAGTRWEKSDQVPLLQDPKQVWEHQIVVQDIQESLCALGSVEIGALEVMQLPGLSHLRTLIEARLRRDIGYEAVVQYLHPTPALGASPRGAGREVFRMMDGLYDRRRFGAPFGIADSEGNGTCLVAIRNLQWEADRAFLAVGCGVVGESVAEKEWAELEVKELAVRRSLGL